MEWIVPFNVGAKDRVFAVGPEFDVILPKHKINFLDRVLPDSGPTEETGRHFRDGVR